MTGSSQASLEAQWLLRDGKHFLLGPSFLSQDHLRRPLETPQERLQLDRWVSPDTQHRFPSDGKWKASERMDLVVAYYPGGLESED